MELDARRAARLRAAECLRGSRTPLTVIDLASASAALAEEATAAAEKVQPPPALACREGCDWCCHLTVGTSAPEVLRIAAFLRQTLSAEDLSSLVERARRLADERRRLRPDQRTRAHLPCALLVEHRCQAHAVRPLTCRGANSQDARRCQAALGSAKFSVPAYAPQQRLATFVLDGLRSGLTESGLSGDLLELTAALRIALETPDAAERWLAGEPIFTPARLD